MLRSCCKSGIIWILLLCHIQMVVKTQIISVDLSSIPNSSMAATSNAKSVILPQSVTEIQRVNLYSYMVNTTSSQDNNGNISDKSNQIPTQNPFDQFIVPVNEGWSSFGNLTLDVLASNEFYVNPSKNTSSNETGSNASQQNKASINSNPALKEVPDVTNSISINQTQDSSNTMMTQNQLASFESQLTQVKQKAQNNTASSVVQPKITNFQFESSINDKTTQNSLNQGSIIATTLSPNLDFSSNNVYAQTTDNTVVIQGLADTINARFNRFFGS